MNKDNLYAQLKIDEGVVHEIYIDTEGQPTFGVGHLVLDSDPESGLGTGTPVSEDRVNECLVQDVSTALDECEVLYPQWNSFPDEVQEILANMMFNMGRPTLSKFRNMNSAIDDEDWATAAVEGRDSKWYRQVGDRAERLMTRLESM